jgi:hypothetical protein
LVDFELSINSLFGLVCSLEAKIQIFSDRMKNTGIQFRDLAFASENKFGLAYRVANPLGAGTAGFVDFISIWQFAALGQADLSTWLTQERNAKAIGFSSTIDMMHAFTMSVLYLSALAGSDKTEILVNVALDALKLVAVWHGGTGDGSKERLAVAMTQAVQAHKKYCEDHVPEGWLREHALKSGQFTERFWLSLASYIEDKIILLQTFNLPERSICLLMSHQLIQMCNDISEFQTNARNVGFDSPEAGGIYAWVGLQDLQCMDG